MERAIDPGLLSDALGVHDALPSAVELGQLIADADIRLVLGLSADVGRLAETAWYLLAVGSVPASLELYGVERQRQAFQVSAHIFDLMLQVRRDLSLLDRLQFIFATQVGYIRSELVPNALAVYRRENLPRAVDTGQLETEPPLVPVWLATALLAGDSQVIFPGVRSAVDWIFQLSQAFEVEGLAGTPFGAAAAVVDAIGRLHDFLINGSRSQLDLAVSSLERGVADSGLPIDSVSRWVAALLLGLAPGLDSASVWSVLPPDVPLGAKRAFTRGQPRVTVLWPPQVETLGASRSLLMEETRRAIVSMPTSAGKTLMAQLLVTTHLARGRGGVCYIAPTRSLCAEIKKGLEQRLRYLDVGVAADLPIGLGLEEVEGLLFEPPAVEVMTPERLSFLLRNDSGAILEKFTLFVFDEVHAVSDVGRGWTVETSLTFLNEATQGKPHVIVALSAALGNLGHFVTWVSDDTDAAEQFVSRWRGPRRLTCIWTTQVTWGSVTRTPRQSATRPIRATYPLTGVLHVRTGDAGAHRRLGTSESIGQLSFAEDPTGQLVRQRETTHSTAFYKMLVPLIATLERAGPVLVIEGTRAATVRLAKAIAEGRGNDSSDPMQSLTALVEARLGALHPLVSVLRAGVGYHHGSLPLDIRSAIEDAVRDGAIKVLVATTTMTEGVNLPVRSVVVARQGGGGSDDLQEYIRGSKLLNAAGRAGRAGLETEGVVVLARQQTFQPSDFALLDPTEEELTAVSSMAQTAALDELAAVELLVRASIDAVFLTAPGHASDFLSFVWFIASELDRLELPWHMVELSPYLERTLAWQQLDVAGRALIRKVAEAGVDAYKSTTPDRRRRWARSGLSLSNAVSLDQIATEVSLLDIFDSTLEPRTVLDAILGDGRLERLLELPGAPRVLARPYRNSPLTISRPVNVRGLLDDWLGGLEYDALATTYFDDVADSEFQSEQLGDTVGALFENHLPWVLGTLVTWANELRTESDPLSDTIVAELPAFIRFGVDSQEALKMMANGLQSRRLAHAIARTYRATEPEEALLEWLRGMRIEQWKTVFEASPRELVDLLDALRVRQAGIAGRVLGGSQASVILESSGVELTLADASVIVQSLPGPVPQQLGIWAAGDPDRFLGTVPSYYQGDVEALLETSLELETEVSVAEDGLRLTIQLAGVTG